MGWRGDLRAPEVIALGQAVRAIRYRTGASLAIFIVGIMAIAVASIGPLYARAGNESILRDALSFAPAQATGLHVQTLQPPAARPLESFHDLVRQHQPYGYDAGTEVIYANGTAKSDVVNSETVFVKTVYRQDVCAHMVIDKGRCPTKVNELLVATRTAKTVGWDVGARIRTARFGNTVFLQQRDVGISELHSTVVGTYHPKDPSESYWFGEDYFNPHENFGEDPNTIDAVFTVPATFEQLSASIFAWHGIDLHLDPAKIRLDEQGSLRRQVQAFTDTIVGGQTNVTTSITDVLDREDDEAHLLKTVVLLVTLQLAILTFLVLFLIVASAAEDRGAEIALAKLRGHRLPTVIQVALAEPMLLLVASAPFGLLAGHLLVQGLASNVLADDTPVFIRTPTMIAVGAALLGGLLAATLGVANIIRRPIAEQWQRTTRSSNGAGVFAALEIALGLGAVVLIVQLYESGSLDGSKPTSSALAIPAIIVLLAGIVGSRALPAACRALARQGGGPSRIASFLALRLVSRRAIGARLTVLLAVAIGLATSAVDISLIAAGNRAQRAATDLGAPTVLSVEGTSTLLRDVRKADPEGRWAMTAALGSSFGGPLQGYILAADLKAFPHVAHWRQDFASDRLDVLLQRLTVPPPGAIAISNGELRIATTYSGTPVALTINIDLKSAHGITTIPIGTLAAGSRDLTAMVTTCASACTLNAIRLSKESSAQYVLSKGSFTIRALSTGGRSVPKGVFADPYGWTHIYGAQPALDEGNVERVANGLRYNFKVPGGDSAGIRRAPAPAPLPIAINPAQLQVGDPVIQDAQAQLTAIKSAGDVAVLPQVKDVGNLVSLEYVLLDLPRFADYAIWQVWLGPKAPPDALERLKGVGVTVQSTKTTAQRRAELDRSGASLGLLLFSFAAGAGALLAPAATAMAIFITARRRAFELAALMAVGVKRRVLVRACLGEQLLVLGTGLVVGVIAGFLGAQLALPNVPEFSDKPIPALQLTPHYGGVLLFVLGMAVLVVATASAAAYALVRSAKPAVLREAG